MLLATSNLHLPPFWQSLPKHSCARTSLHVLKPLSSPRTNCKENETKCVRYCITHEKFVEMIANDDVDQDNDDDDDEDDKLIMVFIICTVHVSS